MMRENRTTTGRPVAVLMGALLLLTLAMASAVAGEGKLFVNLTTDDTWRAGMALKFSENALKKGHPVTVFLDVEAVRLASTKLPQHANAMTGSTPREMLETIIAQGGQVIVCPMCMKQAGVADQDLIKGATVGKPDVTLPALFADDTRVMSH